MKTAIRVCVFSLLAAAPLASQAASVRVPYSGQIAESGVLVSGMRFVSVSLYADSTGGGALATQAESLLVTRGVFHTELRFDESVWPLTAARWIGVSVDGGVELSPRVRVGFVPLAVRSLYASNAGKADSAGILVNPPAGAGVNFKEFASCFTVFGGSSMQKLDSLQITAPASGYVLAMLDGYVDVDVPNGEVRTFDIVLDESPVAPASTGHTLVNVLPYSGSTAIRYKVPFSVSRVFTASAGTHSYKIWVRLDALVFASAGFCPRHFEAVWFANRYP